MSVVLQLVGGPADGDRVELPEIPLRWRVARATPARIPLATDPTQPAMEVWDYEPVLDATGHHSRADDGSYRFECRGMT